MLLSDTTHSALELKGIFKKKASNSLALYFNYKWTLKNRDANNFALYFTYEWTLKSNQVVEFDENNKIKQLKIIYDTVILRKLVEELK
ncbi:hypothetical protein [Echinicola sp. 20G]|uniref:hypothetical protein n=1 Tax=Echinicola sp. 20G TaxID=2781961 RepID=UPI0019101171|nr:hypothetical protein [Echinicola sp. 20G]